MAKGADAFRSIGEVANLIGVAPHVLRYWETQFSLLKPMKRGDGRRYYRPDDVRLAAGLCEVLRDEGLTIRGAKKLLAKDRGEAVRARGALKLGETIEARHEVQRLGGQDAPKIRPVVAPVAVAPVSVPPVAVPVARPPSLAADAATLSDQEGPARQPRVRSRKRPPVRVPEPLPLFPDDRSARHARPVPVDKVQAGWLGELIRVSARLRAHARGRTIPLALRDRATRLLDTIADHY